MVRAFFIFGIQNQVFVDRASTPFDADSSLFAKGILDHS
jgi:hypothetical protein